MPTWLQIESAAWRPYFTAVDEYMGWQSQLGLFPDSLQFEVVGEGGGTVPCAPAESTATAGAIPGFPDDLPRYHELGQLGRDCTWVPQPKGSVTVRARISYNVLLTISGLLGVVVAVRLVLGPVDDDGGRAALGQRHP